MNDVYFSSDLHLGHKNIIPIADRPFKNVEQMNDTITENMFNIPAGSHLYLLGDLAWNQQYLQTFLLQKPKGINIHWILGNHDKRCNKEGLRKYFETVSRLKVIKVNDIEITLCHYPMLVWHRSYTKESWQLFGHIHKNTIDVPVMGKTANMNCEFWDYKPVSFEQLEEYMKNRPENYEQRMLFDE